MEYEVVILGTLGGNRSYAYAINDSGQVVGESTTAQGYFHGFLWENNVMKDLGVLGIGIKEGREYNLSCARSINNSGQIVGWSSHDNSDDLHTNHAFLWENGQMHDIDSLGGRSSHATSINNRGQIVGYSTDLSGNWYEDTHTFLWDHGITTDLGAIQGGRSYAYGINDHAQVVGEFYKPSNEHYNGCTWVNGLFTDLGEIDEYGSFAGAINNSGIIVGCVTFRTENIGIVSQAVMWENYQMINLGYLEYPESFASAINDSGQIVGSSRVIRGNSCHFHACLWQNGKIIDLTRFFPEEAPSHAYDINSSGQIVGCVEMGGTDRAFLMTPIPEQATRLVPVEYPTIQSAINDCNDGDVVVVAPGIYTGKGNRDIDFLGKAIIVRSKNGPQSCIIDIGASQANWHNGFYLHEGERKTSIIEGFTIKGGYAYEGAGVYCGGSSPTIKNCIITKNIGGWGGGIRCYKSNAVIGNCLIVENEGWDAAGGIYCRDSNIRMTNCTISGNISNHGGGILCQHASLTITNCILWGNSSRQIEDRNNDSVISVSFSDIEGSWPGEGNIDTNPMFVDAAAGNLHLQADSPCINAGNPNYVAGPNETDIDGEPRVMLGRVDMGADEWPGPWMIYVDSDANGANNGSSWGDAYKYLQDALADAKSSAKPVEIRVAHGVYKPDEDTLHPAGTDDRTAAFQMINGVTIKGGYAGFGEEYPDERDIALYETILSGDIGIPSDKSDNCFHVFYHPEGLNLDDTAILDGFTITGGNADVSSWPHDSGGGMFNYKSNPKLNVCTFISNSAYKRGGGGMFNYKSSPTAINCTFNGNKAEGQGAYGGGMFNYYYSSPIVKDCTFINNSAYYGGGMLNDKSSPTVKSCTFTANVAYWGNGGGMCNESSSATVESSTFSTNSAKYNGGGMLNYNSRANVEGCTFNNNSANGGGGMYSDYYSSSTVTDCTFTTNFAYYRGGGMQNVNSNPTVKDCTFIGNSADEDGGGMGNWNGSSPTVNNCTLSGNSAKYGGGMYNNNSSPTVEGCTFGGNSDTYYGGGMHNYNSSPTVTNSIFSSNSATYFGGGMRNANSRPTVTNCTFTGNSVANGSGGGMQNANSSPTVEGCTFSGNSATYYGGGMQNYYYSSPTVEDCTFSGNSAYNGGGMGNDYYSSPIVEDCTMAGNSATNGPAVACDSYGQGSPSNVIMANSIVWNGSDWLWNNDGSTIAINYSDVQGGYSGTGNINADPLFVNANNGDYHLLPDSPCINAGDPNFIAEPNETDIDGEVRVMLGRVDMGADEFNPFEVDFIVVNKRRIDRTVFEYDCKVTVSNRWHSALKNLQLELAKVPANVTIVDPQVSFASTELEPGQLLTSIDTCTFRVDRSQPIDSAEIAWWVTCEMVDSGQTIQNISTSTFSLGIGNIDNDLTVDERIDFEDLAELAGQWLQADGDGIVNFRDFARLAERWQSRK